ncbi:MBL fold metallo-hydrolase [Streptomyces yaanensis]|uniref:MBL fold metallo-hydrolase n=1 Tax=Streptomyces yaanensis TaxID=1142239 RepID=A0ABV7SQ94_9ACTN|nr:MBL fold metallo-hydrolase [Streptomyces sp. CGMCC 4.7035]WNC00398.1 MBL fold metallo-hydrolase [Streptomyces sp. CGMCC 4.7035]
MKITHFGHACVLVEIQRNGSTARLLFDPGTYSNGFEDVRDLEAVLITHEHPDHVDVERLGPLLGANPAARLIADPGSSTLLREAGLQHEIVGKDDTVTVAEVPIQVLAGDHAVIHPQLPCTHNNGYLVDGRLLHPGDAFALPPQPVDVLLLPTGGPWMKVSEAIDYLRAVAPRIAIPIHQAGLAPVHQQLHQQLFRNLGPAQCSVQVLEQGTATAV